MRIEDLLCNLDEAIPFSGAEEWDPVGLQVGGSARAAGTVAVCHEITESVVGAVEDSGISTIVAYHPLLFTPTTSFVDGPTAEGRALRLVEAGVSVIVVHTAFDAATPGTGDALAEALGLTVVTAFGGIPDGTGIGRIVTPDRALDAAGLGALVRGRLGVGVRVADGQRPIERIALVPGSGSSLIDEAATLVDALVTGDVTHHHARFASDIGLSIVDTGHAASERPGVEALYAVVSNFVEEAVLLDDDPTPWRD